VVLSQGGAGRYRSMRRDVRLGGSGSAAIACLVGGADGGPAVEAVDHEVAFATGAVQRTRIVAQPIAGAVWIAARCLEHTIRGASQLGRCADTRKYCAMNSRASL
jgi:hypothetical protein